MSILKKLGTATGSIKRAYGFGQQDPFGSSNYFAPYSQGFMPTMMPSGMRMPSPGPVGSDVETPAQRAGDMGGGWNTAGGLFTVAGAASPWAIPFNAAVEGLGYASKGEMPAYSDVEAFRQNYAVDPSKDSFAGAAKKLVGGVGGFLSNPISASRMIAHDADQAWRNDKTYQAAKGGVGSAYNAVSGAIGGAYDRVMNQPISGPAPAPKPVAKPMAKPMTPTPTPSTLGTQTGKVGIGNPAANKPQI